MIVVLLCLCLALLVFAYVPLPGANEHAWAYIICKFRTSRQKFASCERRCNHVLIVDWRLAVNDNRQAKIQSSLLCWSRPAGAALLEPGQLRVKAKPALLKLRARVHALSPLPYKSNTAAKHASARRLWQ